LRDDGSYDISAYHYRYPNRLFLLPGGALTHRPQIMQALFIPLLPRRAVIRLSVKFGNAVNFIGAFSLGRDSWLVVNATQFIMP